MKHFIRTLLCLTLFFTGAVQAQTQNANQDGPTLTDLSQLPGYLKLKQTVLNWNAEDNEIAMGQIKRWLRDHEKTYPIDCSFRVRGPLQRAYETGENRANTESEWLEYPIDAPGFTAPRDPEWTRFTKEILPSLAASFDRAYQGSVPAGLSRLELNGFQKVCNNIKDYLQRRFKANPDSIRCNPHEEYVQTVSIIQREISEDRTYQGTFTSSEAYAVSFYKLSHPHADGLQYSQVSIESCTFEKPKPITEKKLIEPSAKKYIPTPDTSKPGRKSEKQEERDARRKEKQDFKAWEQKQKEEEQSNEKAAKEKEKQFEIIGEDRRLKEYYPVKDQTDPIVHAHTDLGETLIKSYKKLHKTDWHSQPEFDFDEIKLNHLRDQVSEKEEAWIKEYNKKSAGKPLDFKKVSLDSEEPFSILRIPTEIEVTSFEI